MGTIYIGIGHNDDLMVTKLTDIEILMNSCSEGCDHRLDLCIGINFVQIVLSLHSRSYLSVEELPESHGFWRSSQIRRRNLPLRYKSHSSPDSYRNSLPACPEETYCPVLTFFW